MRMLKSLLAAALLAVGAMGTANATPWVDYIDFNPDKKINDKTSFSYTHDIKDNGYDPFFDLALGYTLSIDLYDDNDKEEEKAKIDLPGLTGDATYFNLSGSEFGGWSLLGLIQLALTGELDVTITSKKGDFYLASSTLTVWGIDGKGSREVPEPGTLGLMGLGLLGAGVAARRKKPR